MRRMIRPTVISAQCNVHFAGRGCALSPSDPESPCTSELPFALQNAGRKGVWPIELASWQSLWQAGRAWAPEGVIINPGVRFGPLDISFSGEALDFVWLQSFTPLTREPVFEGLRAEGFSLRGAPAHVKWNSGAVETLIELEIRPKVRLTEKQQGTVCSVCERLEQIAPKKPVLDAASYDDSIPLQRIQELPTFIVSSDALCASFSKHEYSGISFLPLELL
jgi:hypothetical protein